MSASSCTSSTVKDLSDLHSSFGAGTLAQAIADHEVPWQPGLAPSASIPPSPSPSATPVQSVTQSQSPPQGPCGLTIKSLDEILATPDDDSDMIIGDRLIARGQSCGVIGASGLGKSRLGTQLGCSLACGQDFLAFKNHSEPLKVLMLQTENSARRLKCELDRMRLHFGCHWDLLREHLWIQTPEMDDDYLLSLDDPDNLDRVADAVATRNPDVLILDPLNAFAAGDLNKDVDMRETCLAIGEIARRGNAQRAVVVLHHSLTGRAGAVKATGFDRSSFGRNSKVFHAWVRGQINVAPGSADNNGHLVISCGKNSNGPEFPAFAARLVPETMTYEVDPDFNLQHWQVDITGKTSGTVAFSAADVAELLQGVGRTKTQLVKAIMDESGCAKSKAYDLVRNAEELNLISRNLTDKTYGPA